MDEAELRRGADSANARWDNHVAILTGDFLFAKSSEFTAGLGPEAVRIQAETFAGLVEGQILETVPPSSGETALAHYLEVVAGKTGSLIATSAHYGAMFGGASREVVEALTAVRRHRRRGLPTQRRHPRHRLGVGRVGQDAGHRSARGRPHPADPDGAAGHARVW
jgi:geranylgeranyl pyrophosphate synthase